MHGVHQDASGHGTFQRHDAMQFMHVHGEQVLAMMRQGLSLHEAAVTLRMNEQNLRVHCRVLGLQWPRKRKDHSATKTIAPLQMPEWHSRAGGTGMHGVHQDASGWNKSTSNMAEGHRRRSDKMVSKSPEDSSLEAELVAVLEIKREKLEVAEASKQELAARLATLASEANAQVKEAGELRKQLDEIALVLECACCFEKIGAGCAASFGRGRSATPCAGCGPGYLFCLHLICADLIVTNVGLSTKVPTVPNANAKHPKRSAKHQNRIPKFHPDPAPYIPPDPAPYTPRAPSLTAAQW
jgi:hypothetical protein